MSTKHTPGPWRIASSNFDTGFYCIHAKDNTSEQPREIQVAKLMYGSHPYKSYLEKAEANAKLIAAAPKLLEALQNLTTAANMFLAGCGEEIYNNQFKHIEKAQAAIKEATE